MSKADSGEQGASQCIAQTDDGKRCSRPAQDDGFCYQHDEGDPTVDDDDADDADDSADDSETDNEETEDEENEMSESTDSDTSQSDGPAVTGQDVDLWEVRDLAKEVATEFIEMPFDGVIEIEQNDDGDWEVAVEVIERNSIPDTQDILGRYLITVGGDGNVQGYRLTGRYRRGDVRDEQAPEQ